jgi:hypothetical protein
LPGNRTASTRSWASSAEIASVSWTAGACGDLAEEIEDARREHVATDHREVGWRVGRLRLLDDAANPRLVILHAIDGDDAIALRLVAGHLLHAKQ